MQILNIVMGCYGDGKTILNCKIFLHLGGFFLYKEIKQCFYAKEVTYEDPKINQ